MNVARYQYIDNKSLNFLSWAIVSLVFALNIYLLTQKAWRISTLSAVVVLPALYFLLMSDKKVPAIYVAIFSTVTLFNVVCMGWGLYSAIPYMDDLAHFSTAFALVPCCAHCLMSGVIGEMKRRRLLFATIGLCIGLAVGAMWEVLEFAMAVEADYADTVTDIIFDGIGAGLAALWCAYRLR